MNKRSTHRMPTTGTGFTLIELLVVIAIIAVLIALLLATSIFGRAQATAGSGGQTATAVVRQASRDALLVEERNVRAQMEFLAGDALQGRGSGTPFERLAAPPSAGATQRSPP